MQSPQQRIEQDINALILSMKPAASTQFKSDIKDYCKKILNSVSFTKQSSQNPQIFKQKILDKVRNEGNNKKVKECHERINKIMLSSEIHKKGEILKVLYKISQHSNKGNKLSNIFQKGVELSLTRLQTANNISTVSNNQSNTSSILAKPKRAITKQQLSEVRNKYTSQRDVAQFKVVKQVLFVFQNIDSQIIKLNRQNDAYWIQDNITTSQTVRQMIRYLGQAGWLFKKITSSKKGNGCIQKSLMLAVQQQIGQFYKFLAGMELGMHDRQINLRLICCHIYQPMQRLKWLAMILQAVQNVQGCKIITVINNFRPHGDSIINVLLVNLLCNLIQPLLQFIHNWMYKGQLIDSHKQFFVQERSKVNQFEEWSQKYKLVQQKIPNILDKQTAMMIFNAGKTLNFLKNRCKCNYSIPIPFIDYQKIVNQQIFQSTHILSEQFKKWLTLVYENLSQKLITELKQKFNLKYHIQSMKHFYLMGKGDFIQQLVDSLKQELSKPKHQIFQNTLDGYISDSLGKSFQDFKIDLEIKQPKQIQAQLQNRKNRMQGPRQVISEKMIKLNTSTISVHNKKQITFTNSYRNNILDRILSKKVDFGETTWDSFNFQYSMERIQPLYSILTPQFTNNYQRIFQFLWKIKRIQNILKQIWLINQKQYPKSLIMNKFPQFVKILHRCHLLRSNMSHFLNNYYGYLMIAIESAWDKFYNSFQKALSLDQIITEHYNLHKQLANITFNSTNKKILYQSLMNVFKSIEQFKTVQTKILTDYSQFYQRLRSYENRRKIMAKGILCMQQNELQNPSFDQGELVNRINEVEDIYNKTFKTLFQNLKKQSQGGVLVFRLDFSEYYATKEARSLQF